MTDAPYNDYVDKVILSQVPNCEGYERSYYDFSDVELRSLLADAWMDGLAYSLELIEPEPISPEDASVLQVRLRDEPKSFQGGTKMTVPILYEGCR